MNLMKIKFLLFTKICALILGFFTTVSFSQDNSSSATYTDICHVYVVDTAKSKKLEDLYIKSEKPEIDETLLKLKRETEINFPEFKTNIGEENLITKHYPFPNSILIITASVYYTDESMTSRAPKGNDSSDSMIIGISVSKKQEISSIAFPPLNSAITEVTYDEYTNVVRAKQYVSVKGNTYLVGLECDCATKRAKKKEESK